MIGRELPAKLWMWAYLNANSGQEQTIVKKSRRDFLKGTAFAAGSAIVAGGANQAQAAEWAGGVPLAAVLDTKCHSVIENVKAKDGSAVIFERAEISPTVVMAGDSIEYVIKLTIGKGYTSGKSRWVVDFPGVMGQSRMSLWHNEDHGWIEAYVSNPDVVYDKKLWDIEIDDIPTKNKSSWRGMAQRMLILNLGEGLKEGDTVEMRWGDSHTQRGFAVGCKTCTVVPVKDFKQTIHVRYFDDPEAGLPDMARSFKGYDRPEPICDAALSFVVAPRPLHHTRLIRKVDKAILLPQDVFWNVVSVDSVDDLVSADSKAVKNDSQVWTYADKDVQVKPKAVPLIDSPTMDNVFEGKNIYWGDLHNHTLFSNDVIERERMELTPDDTFTYGRQRAGLDFMSVSDHHQPWDRERNKIGAELWARTSEYVRKHNNPGQFTAFAGFEFRGPRGDTVVIFRDPPDYREIDRPEWKDIRKLWEGLGAMDYITIPHYHNGGGLPKGQWWDNIETGVETAIEIFSCHGSYERTDVQEQNLGMMKGFRVDRTGEFFLKSGRKYAFAANSDSHKGHPGVNGITGVFAESLDKDSIFEAYRKRHVYGTTNARIRLVFTGNGKLMGSVVPNTTEKTFLIDVAGENRLKKVDLFRNGVHHGRFYPAGAVFRKEYVVKDDGPSNWYCRATQVDNQIAWSSPIWFE